MVLPGFVTVEEAAERTGYNQEYIRQLARGEKIAAQRIGKKKSGATWLIDLADLLEHQANARRGRPAERRGE